METENTTKKRNSILWKGCFVLLVALVLQIPVLMVRGLVYDRKDLSNEVKAELVSSWGGMMEVTTPQLRVSYVAEANGKMETLDRDIKSSDVAIEAKVNSQIRHRSIYDIPVYSSDMTINGKFEIDEKSLEGSNGNIKLMLPFNKLKGIEGRPVVVVGGKEYAVKVYGKELAAELPYDVVAGSQVLEYIIRIKTNGMDRIRFYPGASLYNVKMKSNYNSPGFKGDFLPVDRTISESGFEAQWIVTDLNTIASNTSSIPIPFLAEIRGASWASMPITSSISFFTRSGSALGKSILLITGKTSKSWSNARYTLASVCASIPWAASTTKIAPSQAARLRLTS